MRHEDQRPFNLGKGLVFISRSCRAFRRPARLAACDVDPDDLRPTDRFGAERLGEHRAERLGEEPVGVFLRLPEGDEPEPAVVGSSDIAPSRRGGASPSSARTLSNCSIDPNGGMATVIHCMAVLLDVSRPGGRRRNATNPERYRHPWNHSSRYSSPRAHAPRGDLASRGEPQLGEDVPHVVSAVRSEMTSRSAICRLVRPSATSRATSASRELSTAGFRRFRYATSAAVRWRYAVMPRARARRSASRAADSARSRCRPLRRRPPGGRRRPCPYGKVVKALDVAAELIVPGLRNEPAWPTLRAHQLLLATHGTDPVAQLAAAAGRRELNSAEDRAAVLDWRLDRADREEGGRRL